MSDSSLPAVDPRVAVRRPITLRVRLAWDVDECLGYSTNISLSGIYVETRDYLPEGTAVRVEFDLAEAGGLGRVYVDGAVARHIGEKEAEDRQLVPGVGIRFGEFVVGKFDLIRFLTPTKKAAEPVEADPLEPAPDEGDERRVAARVATGLPVAWGRADPPDAPGYLANLSTTGAFSIQTDKPCAVGEKIYLMFELPRTEGRGVTRVRAIAHVVRTVEPGGARPAGMGVHFDTASVDVETIRQFVKGRRAWERQLTQEGSEKNADWVAPSRDLPPGIEPRRASEGSAPSRGRSMKKEKPRKVPKKKASVEPISLPHVEIRWKWISLVLACALLVLSVVFALSWVFGI